MTARARTAAAILVSSTAWAACVAGYIITNDQRWIGGSLGCWFGGVALVMTIIAYDLWHDDEPRGPQSYAAGGWVGMSYGTDCFADCPGACPVDCPDCRDGELADSFVTLDRYSPTAEIGEDARDRDWLADVSDYERDMWATLRRQLDGGDDAGVRA